MRWKMTKISQRLQKCLQRDEKLTKNDHGAHFLTIYLALGIWHMRYREFSLIQHEMLMISNYVTMMTSHHNASHEHIN